MIHVQLRLEQPGDYKAVEALTYRAFETMELPGREYTDEHLLAHKLRSCGAFLPELDFVALQGDRIVGNIMYTRSKVVDVAGTEHGTITFGPLSVLPELHGQSVGAQLVHHSLAVAEQLGHKAVLILGHPGYYHRFGFTAAGQYGITLPDGSSFDAFMALELEKGFLGGVSGKFYADPIFEIPREELEIFNRTFLLSL